MKKVSSRLKKIFLFFTASGALFFPGLVLAAQNLQNATEKLNTVAGSGGAGLPSQDIMAILSNVIFAVFSLIGALFLILMIYGGYTWLMARGDESHVQKAKDIIKASIIGLIIIVGAYAISKFVMAYVLAG